MTDVLLDPLPWLAHADRPAYQQYRFSTKNYREAFNPDVFTFAPGKAFSQNREDYS